nr:hypothetical protein CFP56_04420 [Quercus suber]
MLGSLVNNEYEVFFWVDASDFFALRGPRGHHHPLHEPNDTRRGSASSETRHHAVESDVLADRTYGGHRTTHYKITGVCSRNTSSLDDGDKMTKYWTSETVAYVTQGVRPLAD